MSKEFSETVMARIAVDHPFTQALLVETQQELVQAYEALKMAREGLRLWKMDISFIDEIVGPDSPTIQI